MEDNFNKHLGNKLKLRRLALGLTQTKVAKAINVTFQQIQKYERGLNRIGSSRLYEFARVLSNSVSYFFEGMETVANDSSHSAMAEDSVGFEYENLANKEVLSLVRAFSGITDQKVRKDILSLVKSLSNSASAEAPSEQNATSK